MQFKYNKSMINNSNQSLRLPVGISNFEKLATEGYRFVDKSLFIKEIIQDGADVILITRPRRFGKTLTLSMLYHFLKTHHKSQKNLFTNLAISEDNSFCEKHQNKHYVIFLSFKEIKKPSYEQAYAAVVELLADLYAQHRYLLEGDDMPEDEKNRFISILNQDATQTSVESAIKKLSYYIHERFAKKVIILIDEYDTPIQEAYLEGYYDQMIKLMRGILGASLKDNDYLHKAVVTGITRVAQESIFSGVNNFEVYSLLREAYGQYFGFTEGEVSELINAMGNQVSLEAVKEWYNGYRIGSHTMYNPWSILSCLKNKGILRAYWLNTTSNELIKRFIEKANGSIRDKFEELLQGKVIEKPLMENLIFPELNEKEEAIWSLLLYAGYLTVLHSDMRGFELIAEVSVPNKEVMFIYDAIVAGWFRRGSTLAGYREFVHALVSNKMDVFKRHLSEYLMETGSYFDFNKNTPEKVFHSFMLGLVVGLKENYIIQSNQESGLGRFDIIFIPKHDKTKNGILLEFKVSDDAELLLNKAQEALQQIKDQRYITLFKSQGIISILAIGMAFCGKEVELAHERLEIK